MIKKIRKTLKNAAGSFGKMKIKYHLEMEKIKERINTNILKVLDSKQQGQFHKMMERFERFYHPSPKHGFHRGLMEDLEKELHLKLKQKEKRKKMHHL